MNDAVTEALEKCSLLSRTAIEALFARYGRPLELPEVVLDPVILVDGAEVGRLSHRAPVDVIANDHFVLRAGAEPLAMPGPLFAAAVAALTRSREP
ncbi:MAG: hypothetical protein ABI321_23675 [Polyangia bacterium]